jgi:hypothetical protein
VAQGEGPEFKPQYCKKKKKKKGRKLETTQKEVEIPEQKNTNQTLRFLVPMIPNHEPHTAQV